LIILDHWGMMKTSSQKRRDFVLTFAKVLGVAGTTSIVPKAFAKGRSTNITSVSLKKSDNGSQRLVFELDKSVRHKFFILTSPNRIVIDFENTQAKSRLTIGRNSKTKQLITSIRQSSRNKKDFRVVLDMANKTKASTKLTPHGSGYLLEVAFSPSQSKKSSPQPLKKAISAVTFGVSNKPITIAIDAGHGGKDPGAVGRRGTKEKHIALQIAKRLKKQIDRQPGMKAVMIRDGDYYISLRKRILKASAKKADLFISIHADANPNRKLTGSSVYILSERGASSASARWLARNENSYESRVTGHSGRGNPVVSSLLLDLSLSDTIDKSLGLANGVLKELGGVNRLLRHSVESAAFAVLKSPDIPSMLVETAFISNSMEEKRLKTARYQEKLAKAIFKGIRRYQVALNDSENVSTRYS